jgi:hypothetical protein
MSLISVINPERYGRPKWKTSKAMAAAFARASRELRRIFPAQGLTPYQARNGAQVRDVVRFPRPFLTYGDES